MTNKQRNARVRVDPARLAAYDVLKAVRVDGGYANLVLAEELRKAALRGRDAALTTELAAGTIRRQGTYDQIINHCLTKPKLQESVRDVLRLGAHQLLATRIPQHAAISSSVELTKARIGPGPTGLVNAVLRKIAAGDLDGWMMTLAAEDPTKALALRHSHPEWMVDALATALRQHGTDESGDELAALLAADNEAPRVTLVARPGLADPAELPGDPGRFSPYAVYSAGGDPADLPAIAHGRAGVQDEGSQLVALGLAQAHLEGRDARWLDLCAGPGGKAALLGALAHLRGATLVANEVQPHRAELVRRGVAQLPGIEAVTERDGRRTGWEAGSFDRVLVDAPCSGLGALRRRPEARWRKQPSDLPALVKLQAELLAEALRLVRAGGVVGYATCSPLPCETLDVVSAALANGDCELVPFPLDLPDAAGGLEHTMQTWPHRHGCDAMFLALLRRV